MSIFYRALAVAFAGVALSCSNLAFEKTTTTATNESAIAVLDAPVVTEPAVNARINDSTPRFSGTGLATATVNVKNGTSALCTATVGGDSKWSCDSNVTLSEGPYTVTVTQADTVTTSPETNRGFVVDLTAPALPVVSAPAHNAYTNVGKVIFSGTSEVASGITVNVTSKSCTTTTNSEGKWQCQMASALPDGPYTATVYAVDIAGNATSNISRAFTVDTKAPPSANLSEPASKALLTDTTPSFKGQCERGVTMRVYFDGSSKEACTAVVDMKSEFVCTPTTPLKDGTHTFVVTSTDLAGNSATTESDSITIVTGSGSLYPIGDNGVVSTTSDTILGGTGTPGRTVNIYLDLKLVGSAIVGVASGGDARWVYSLAPLSEGDHTVEIGVTGADGTEVYHSKKVTITARIPKMSFGGPIGCSSGFDASLFSLVLVLGFALVRPNRVRSSHSSRF